MKCPVDHTNTMWQQCEKCGGCWDTAFVASCPECFPECPPDCEYCPCENCNCPVREHFEPDASMCAENGIDMEEAYCAGKLNTCGMCGECYAA